MQYIVANLQGRQIKERGKCKNEVTENEFNRDSC